MFSNAASLYRRRSAPHQPSWWCRVLLYININTHTYIHKTSRRKSGRLKQTIPGFWTRGKASSRGNKTAALSKQKRDAVHFFFRKCRCFVIQTKFQKFFMYIFLHVRTKACFFVHRFLANFRHWWNRIMRILLARGFLCRFDYLISYSLLFYSNISHFVEVWF